METAQGLTPQQEHFCQEWIVDHNGTQAAIRAGYSAKTAYSSANRLLKRPKIKARIQGLEKATLERVGATQEWVIQELVASYESAKESGQHGPAVRALELLGKRHGMFKDVVEDTRSQPDLPSMLAQLAEANPGLAAMLAKELGVSDYDRKVH